MIQKTSNFDIISFSPNESKFVQVIELFNVSFHKKFQLKRTNSFRVTSLWKRQKRTFVSAVIVEIGWMIEVICFLFWNLMTITLKRYRLVFSFLPNLVLFSYCKKKNHKILTFKKIFKIFFFYFLLIRSITHMK